MRLALVFLALSSGFACAQQPAPAAEATLKLSAEDQKNFREVCAIAMRNPAIGTDMTYNVSAWCLEINGKIAQSFRALRPEATPQLDHPKE